MKNVYKLSNGLRLVYEKMPFAKSASIGVWVRAGSIYENKNENGISHFAEHMLFKGTLHRTAAQIACEADCIGGQLNAYTERDHTCYYTRVPAVYLPKAVEILSDMYYNSLFEKKDTELERGVIEEEINMYEDSPEELAEEKLFEMMWHDNPHGRPIAGTVKSVRGIGAEDIQAYVRRQYTSANTVLSVAGQFDKKELILLCEKYFGGGNFSEQSTVGNAQFFGGERKMTKSIEQTHISVGYEAFSFFDKRIYALSVLNSVFGGSTSGRLFRAAREESGLCYSIYSYTTLFENTGMMGIYAATSEENAYALRQKINEETEKICTEKITEDELNRAREIIKCGIVLDSELCEARMNINGKDMLFLNRLREEDEIIHGIDNVTAQDVMQCARKILDCDKKAVFILNGGD